MPFGIIRRTGSGMRQVVGFGDRSTGRATFGGEFGARHCNQWGLYGVRVRQRRDAALFPNYFGQTCFMACSHRRRGQDKTVIEIGSRRDKTLSCRRCQQAITFVTHHVSYRISYRTRRFTVDFHEYGRHPGTLVLSQLQQLVTDVAAWPTVTQCFQLKPESSCVRTTGRRPVSMRSVCGQPRNVQ